MSNFHYLIDGYNLLFKLPGKHHSLEIKRRTLLDLLEKQIAEFGLSVTIVFDGAQRDPLMSVRGHFKTMEVVYTAANQTADDYIYESIAEHPRRHIVVTSDRDLATKCKALGAQTQKIQDFLSSLVTKHHKKKRLHEPLPKFQDSKADIDRLLKIFEQRLEEDAP